MLNRQEQSGAASRGSFRRTVAALLLAATAAWSGAVAAAAPADRPAAASGAIEREGVRVEFSLVATSGAAAGGAVVEGAEARVRFRLSDATTGAPLKGLRLSAWIDQQRAGQAEGDQACRGKVQSFLQGNLSARPSVDLNSYQLLALNQEPNISVIDPLGGFGSTKLLKLVGLPSPGEDWVLTRDQRRLYVSMPLVNQIAVVDTDSWKVTDHIDAGFKPGRLVLQADGKYLWAALGDRTVAVVDPATLKVVTRIDTGAGPHELLLSPDDSRAFATNRADGTLSVIDVQRLKKLVDVPVGTSPVTLAYSRLAGAAYVGSSGDGMVVAVDARTSKVSARISTRPGVQAIRFTPDGRFGLVANRIDNTVQVLDVASSKIVRSIPVGVGPEQISFTDTFAYVRSTGTSQVSTIRLSTLDKEPHVVTFPGGQKAPERSSSASLAPAIVPAPEGAAVYVANPADQALYYYSEGMAAPQGALQNYRREARAVLLVDRSLRETEPGVYSAQTRLPAAGQYDVALVLDVPRVLHCFVATARPDPALAAGRAASPSLEYLVERRNVPVSEPVMVRFRLRDGASSKVSPDFTDVQVLSFRPPGASQSRNAARPVGDGIYEARLSLPQAGVYYVFVEAPSAQVRYNRFPPLMLNAVDRASASGDTKP